MQNLKIIKAQLSLLSDATGVGFVCTNGARSEYSNLYRSMPSIAELKTVGTRTEHSYSVREEENITYTSYTNTMRSRYLYVFDIGKSESANYWVETDVTSDILFNRSKDMICGTMSILRDVFEVTEERDRAILDKITCKPSRKDVDLKTELSVIKLTRAVKDKFSIMKICILNRDELLYSAGGTTLRDLQHDIFRIVSAERGKLMEGNTLKEYIHLIDDNSTMVMTTKPEEALEILGALESKFRALTSLPLRIGICAVHYPLVNNLSQILSYLSIGIDAMRDIPSSKIISQIDMSDTLGEDAISKYELSEELRDVVHDKQDELIVMYQPKVDTITQEIVGAEGLVRWINPLRGFIRPDEFIPMSERMGLIKEVGKIVLEQVIRDSNILHEATDKALRLGVNVSAIQLEDDVFINHLVGLIETGVCDPEMLDLEITESVAALDINHVIALLSKVRDMGVTISLDDFGTGYSSLNYIKNLPIDTLKIDKSFVDTVEDEDTLCSDIIDISKKLDIKTVAEGVETKEQWHRLRDFNCDILQGYYFSKPVPFDELIKLIVG